MFPKSLLAFVLFVAFTTAAPIPSTGPGSDLQYLARRGGSSPKSGPPAHPPAHHDDHHHTPAHPPAAHSATHHDASHPLTPLAHPHSGGSPPHSPNAHPASHPPNPNHAAGGHHAPEDGKPHPHPHTPPHSSNAHPAAHQGDGHHAAHEVEGKAHAHPHTPPHSPNAKDPNGHTHEQRLMIDHVRESGRKISPEDVLHIWPLGRKLPNVNSEHAWLEKGDERSGMKHIWDKHQHDFEAKGIQHHDIPALAEHATQHGEIVGKQGSTRTVYKVDDNNHVAVEMGNNGYLVSMNPSSGKSLKKAVKNHQASLAKPAPGAGDHASGPGGTTARR